MCSGFSEELQCILSHMSHPNRKTLLFSATLTSSLEELQQLAISKEKVPLLFDLTKQLQIPPKLTQQYLFIPSRIKTCYLACFLKSISASAKSAENDQDDQKQNISSQLKEILSTELKQMSSNENKKNNKNNHKNNKKNSISKKNKNTSSDDDNFTPPYSLIIFVGTCKRCEEISETLRQLG